MCVCACVYTCVYLAGFMIVDEADVVKSIGSSYLLQGCDALIGQVIGQDAID